MDVSIFEIGNFYDVAGIIKVFSTEEEAIENIPGGFKRIDIRSRNGLYYEDSINKKWLTIKIYEIEE